MIETDIELTTLGLTLIARMTEIKTEIETKIIETERLTLDACLRNP